MPDQEETYSSKTEYSAFATTVNFDFPHLDMLDFLSKPV